MSIYVTPIPRLTAFAAPALTLGTANAAGTAETTIATDSTLLAFDTTVPSTNSYGTSSATGSAVVASRRDHVHGMPAAPALLSNIVVGTRTASAGAGDQSISGFGFDPTTINMMLRVTTRTDNGSYGWGDDDEDEYVWSQIDATVTWYSSPSLGVLDPGTADVMSCVLKEYISDGVTITWSKYGAGADITFAIIGMR